MTPEEMPWAREASEIFDSFLSGSFLSRTKTIIRLNEIIGAAYHTGHAEGRASMREAAARVAERAGYASFEDWPNPQEIANAIRKLEA